VSIASFTPVRSARTFEAVVDQIADAIRIGEVARGDRLPAERALAERMGVSRPTLREAIGVLARAGVVEVLPGPAGGTFVISDVIPASLAEGTESRLAAIPAVLQARRAFEPAVAQLAAVHGGKDDLAALERVVTAQRAVVNDWARITQLDNRFHHEMARATRNPVIVSMMTSLSRELEIARATRAANDGAAERAVSVNAETLEAIRSGDRERIEVVMDHHLSLLERAWEDAGRG
jgi:GntR family transcriptional regulator, transcriptional repressor for pyruvate dehydrogenase complex